MSKNAIQFSNSNILLRILEHMSHIKLYLKYSSYAYNYSNIIINKLVYNSTCSVLSKYKDFLILNNKKEYIYHFYSKHELYNKLKTICFFYEKKTRSFPNYFILYESKYIYKNIRKKQKMIASFNILKNNNNMIKEYEINNNCFDNEVFKGPLFTDEVQNEIENEENIINSNYTNNNENYGDSLFKNINMNKYDEPMQSFISNNESNGSLYNIMELLNENKIYVDDLKLLLNNDEDFRNINNNNYIKIGDKLKKYKGIRQILIKGNFGGKKISNNVNNIENSKDLTKPNNNVIEYNSNFILNDKKVFEKPNFIQVQNPSKTIKKKIQNKEVEKINNTIQNNIKDKNNNKKVNPKINNYQKLIYLESNNKDNSKEKILLENIDDFSNLQIIGRIVNTNNHYLLSKTNQNCKQEPNTIIRKKIIENNQRKPLRQKQLNSNQFNTIKNYIKYKHISQDFCTYFNKSKENNNSVKKKLNFGNSLSKNIDKIKNKNLNSKLALTKNSIKNSENINNNNKLRKPTIINNQIIIHNHNNYYLTEENNCYNTERGKKIIYLKDIEESRTDRYQRKIDIPEKNNEENIDFANLNTENIDNNRISITNNPKIKKINNAKFYKNLISKQREKILLKKSYKNDFNNNNLSNFSYNDPKMQNNIIRKIKNYKRYNSNLTEKYIKSINSISQLKKYNSNSTEDFISQNKDISKNDTLKRINCYSHIDKNYKYKINNIKRNTNSLLYKTNSTKMINNKKFLQVSDIIFSDSSRNIIRQRLLKKQPTDYLFHFSKDELKNNKYHSNHKILIINDNENMAISSFNTERNTESNNNIINGIESYKNKKQNIYKSKKHLIKNKFVSCDFDIMKNENNSFSKGILDKINIIKKKINEGIYRNKQSSNIIKKENTYNLISNIINKYSNRKKDVGDQRIKSQKKYKNNIINNENKENIQEQLLIKVNKTKYFDNN